MVKTLFSPIIPLVLLALVLACSKGSDRLVIDVSGVEVEEVKIRRYGKTIFGLEPSNLQQELKRIKPQFPIFLDGDLDDPETMEKMTGFVTDELLIAANRDCQQAFENISWLEKDLTEVFKYLKHYYPGQQTPEVYTYVSGYDFEFRTQFYNDNLLIALDMYLGADYPAYQKLGLPQYAIRKFQPPFIPRDCAYEIGRSKINFRNPGNDLLFFMINEGKLLWFTRALIPDLEEEILFDFTVEQLAWVRQNERLVWAFMIENEVLYSPEPDYKQKFILDSPFTAYFGQESPPRLGAYIGYRIVDSYMQRKRDVSLEMLMMDDNAPVILKESRYKPG